MIQIFRILGDSGRRCGAKDEDEGFDPEDQQNLTHRHSSKVKVTYMINAWVFELVSMHLVNPENL